MGRRGVAEALTTVLPPTQRPWMSGMNDRPDMTCVPASRIICRKATLTDSPKLRVFTHGPSSTMATEKPAFVSV